MSENNDDAKKSESGSRKGEGGGRNGEGGSKREDDSKKEKDESKNKEDGLSENEDDDTSKSNLELQGKKVQSKSLRFQLPPSDESFMSALSQTFGDNDDDYEDFSATHTSVLQKFVIPPLPHSQPRKPVRKPCLSQSSELDFLILPTASSRQLFQIVSDSPTPSDANLDLVRATYLRKLDSVKEAIENGANVNIITDRQTPLLLATEIGDDRLVAYLLTVPKVNPDFRNEFGQTALLVAVRNSFTKIVQLLLNHNADVNLADHMGKTPLHAALFQKRPHLVKLLLAYGADVEKEDHFGERPVYTSAVKKPNMECLMTLLKMGAAVNYINFSGVPLLSRIIQNGTEFQVVETIIKYGALVNIQDLVSKKTPLHFACLIDNLKVVKLLVSQGADVNLRTTYNFTPLDEAIFHRHIETAEYLQDVMQLPKRKSAFSKIEL